MKKDTPIQDALATTFMALIGAFVGTLAVEIYGLIAFSIIVALAVAVVAAVVALLGSIVAYFIRHAGQPEDTPIDDGEH